jgi:hypothetical protein
VGDVSKRPPRSSFAAFLKRWNIYSNWVGVLRRNRWWDILFVVVVVVVTKSSSPHGKRDDEEGERCCECKW